MRDDDLLRGPDEETRLRVQNDKETLGTASNRQPPPWKIGDHLDDFVLEKLLGSGSSGFVYRALDLKTNRRCALKLLRKGSPDDLLRNKLGFRRMMSLDHPNLLRVDRIHQLGSYIALSMEEVQGQTFKQALRDFRNLPAKYAYSHLLKSLRDFASGLAAMHSHGYIHRDIKPDNLMVDHFGSGRVIDYGLVEAFELNSNNFSARGFLLGTPHYIAPEVIWSQSYLPAGDIFSLGIVILDALRALQKTEQLERIGIEGSEGNSEDDAELIGEALDELADSVPTVIRETCREMLDRDPAERPTAMALARLGLPTTQRIAWMEDAPLIGRESEMKEIQRWVDSIFAGNVGRLHLTGESGLGKSRLVAEMIHYIESKNWGQVFNARCRAREDQPLQAFDQICDAIAHRYMKGDRERLELDPVSVSTLQNIFPVLKNVLHADLRLPPAGESTQRLDALEAAVRLSERLREVGPLFVVVDDAQWADRDSRAVLDQVQTGKAVEGLGIVTVARTPEDPYRIPSSSHLHLQPLDTEDGISILQQVSERWSVRPSQTLLCRLAETAGGSPFRLRELADEFRPGGALHELDQEHPSTIAELSQIEHLWHQRAERLSDEARQVLPFVVTAEGAVSTAQLGELTSLADSVDAAISELARQRLIVDEATGGECISIFHDQVADQLISLLSEKEKQKAHLEWASLLVQEGYREGLAARIASHFFAADHPGRAVDYAVRAAEDAERRMAMAEAGRWYRKVVQHVSGDERITQLRNAARCYREADFPTEAAECFQSLSNLVEGSERIECLIQATVMSMRGGRFPEIRNQLTELAWTLGLPKPKPPLSSRLALFASGLRLAAHGRRALLESIITEASQQTPEREPLSAGPAASPHAEPQEGNLRKSPCMTQLRIGHCLSLIRPLTFFDNQYATELMVTGARLALRHGTLAQRIHVAVGQAVFNCYDKGRARTEGEAMLLKLKSHVQKVGSESATGDVWAGIAWSHTLACRWDQVSQPVVAAIGHYDRVVDTHGFELSHTQCTQLWANWHLGRWDQMQSLSDSLIDDATRRDDLFQQIVSTSSYGAGVWLARDSSDQFRVVLQQNAEALGGSGPVQLMHCLDWLARALLHLYESDVDAAWEILSELMAELRYPPYRRMQWLRVAHSQLAALTALHAIPRQPPDSPEDRRWISRAKTMIEQLRDEQLEFATALADLYQGLLWIQSRLGNESSDAESSGLAAARETLIRARDACHQLRLRPYELAAEDAISLLQTGEATELLAARMRQQQVAQPSKLARLYTPLSMDANR